MQVCIQCVCVCIQCVCAHVLACMHVCIQCVCLYIVCVCVCVCVNLDKIIFLYNDNFSLLKWILHRPSMLMPQNPALLCRA